MRAYFICNTVCLPAYLSERLGRSQTEIYNLLARSGILQDYIVASYDVLHTFGKDYLMEDLIGYMREKKLVA